ncbi:uncharacterized protein B0P05DRAFT_118392 [Gilbertella persicaria]|uniref:uncharacterized protein n=1 Tax=Gilbertella persicaria TaxID=101096 RepID=UPI0022200A3E|nr:uncharacterized protein B0P05DRAFT_118392 [Gilbertella persicaria]KAI8077946.1 hypothetical protein B0P05DRAFT_118392 [Gilbertella persicaria]
MTNDSQLAYLLNLGFEIELCQQALEENATLEDATEWILNPSRPPTLIRQELTSSRPVSSSSELSKLEWTDKGVTDRDIRQTQRKEFNKIASELKKERQLEREARQRALREIQEDKEQRKQRTHKHATNKIETKPTQVASNSSSSSSNEQQAFIQLKLTDSSTIRQTFPAQTTIKELVDFVSKKESNLNQNNVTPSLISLVNVFPRRTYTNEDGSLSLRDAGFLPNVSLNVHISKHVVDPESEDITAEGDTDNQSLNESIQGNDSNSDMVKQKDKVFV